MSDVEFDALVEAHAVATSLGYDDTEEYENSLVEAYLARAQES